MVYEKTNDGTNTFRLGPNHWVKLNILTQIISSSSQVSAGHGVQLALQFNGKVSRRDDGLEIYQD